MIIGLYQKSGVYSKYRHKISSPYNSCSDSMILAKEGSRLVVAIQKSVICKNRQTAHKCNLPRWARVVELFVNSLAATSAASAMYFQLSTVVFCSIVLRYSMTIAKSEVGRIEAVLLPRMRGVSDLTQRPLRSTESAMQVSECVKLEI